MASNQAKNGAVATNGYSKEKSSSSASSSQKNETPAPPHNKSEGLVKSIKKLRVASKRPLPTEMGDGSYRQVVNRPGLKQDVRRLRAKGE
jgi:linoleate 10R-lipoxygenase